MLDDNISQEISKLSFRDSPSPDNSDTPLQDTSPPFPSIFLNLPNPYCLTSNPNHRARIFPSMLSHTAYSTGRSANHFFHSPDMCTLLANLLLNDLSTMLSFRALTRASYHTATTERAGRITLLLLPDPDHNRGELRYCNRSIRPKRRSDWQVMKFPFIIHDPEFPLPVGIRETPVLLGVKPNISWSITFAKFITLHPAVQSTFIFYPLEGSALYIPGTYDYSNIPPLHLDMFLTQPPSQCIEQKRSCARNCRFRHFRLPYFKIERKEGVRLRDVVEYFEQRTRGGVKGFQKRCVCWEVKGVISKKSEEGRRAVGNSKLGLEGEGRLERFDGEDIEVMRGNIWDEDGDSS